MKVDIKESHPTQLYLSEKKLEGIQTLYQSAEIINVAQSVFLRSEIACLLQMVITGLIRLYWWGI